MFGLAALNLSTSVFITGPSPPVKPFQKVERDVRARCRRWRRARRSRRRRRPRGWGRRRRRRRAATAPPAPTPRPSRPRRVIVVTSRLLLEVKLRACQETGAAGRRTFRRRAGCCGTDAIGRAHGVDQRGVVLGQREMVQRAVPREGPQVEVEPDALGAAVDREDRRAAGLLVVGGDRVDAPARRRTGRSAWSASRSATRSTVPRASRAVCANGWKIVCRQAGPPARCGSAR